MIKEQLTLTVSNNQLELVTSRVLIDADGTFTYYRWGDVDYLKPFKQTVEGKKLDLTNVKTIYFAPKCSIPRDKAKPFLEEKKIKTVRDRATADVIIAGIESVESGINSVSDKSVDSGINFDSDSGIPEIDLSPNPESESESESESK